jgi:hypothetical protein
MQIKHESYAAGTSVVWLVKKYQHHQLSSGRVLCSDGRLRRIKFHKNTLLYWTGSVKIKGKTVTGFVVREDSVLKFVPYAFHKNADVLLEWNRLPFMRTPRDHCPQYIPYTNQPGFVK